MSHLFSPYTIKSITFKNRIVTSPMCMFSAVDGYSNDWHFVHYGTRAIGGSGTVIVEATAVTAQGRIASGDLGIYKEEHVPGLKRIANFISENGAVPGIQLAHAGRKGSTWISGRDRGVLSKQKDGWDVISPSAIKFDSDMPLPIEMTLSDIQEVQEAFAIGAKRALEAGFQLIEIHSAHGYLLNQFLSPISNQREDEYGGSLENRARMLLETVQEVKQVWPSDLPISVRISATDWVDEGWGIDDSIWLTHRLAEVGVDIIDVSTGGTLPHVKIPVGPGYQLPFASQIKRSNGNKLAVATVGMITTAEQAESILVNGDADFIVMARELLRNPYFPLEAAQKLRENIDYPKQYEQAYPKKK
ncbi:MAG: NADH:flavin oxidoreductase/NADH oxidase [Brumimicrobium sp.]|nr:NADH:flavin oxidoreductase/NADH oxidase [Brumimicrobium sp.]